MRPEPTAETGQILPTSEFGKLLTELAARAEVIVEIGTWHGLGSTLCLAKGLVRPSQRLWTVEPSKACWREASSYWKDEPRITLLQGTTEQVIEQLPKRVDLLLLDGGELEGWNDFLLLWQRAKVIALDDVKEQKNFEAFNKLLHENWQLLRANLDDRNGWAVFERPEFDSP